MGTVVVGLLPVLRFVFFVLVGFALVTVVFALVGFAFFLACGGVTTGGCFSSLSAVVRVLIAFSAS